MCSPHLKYHCTLQKDIEEYTILLYITIVTTQWASAPLSYCIAWVYLLLMFSIVYYEFLNLLHKNAAGEHGPSEEPHKVLSETTPLLQHGNDEELSNYNQPPCDMPWPQSSVCILCKAPGDFDFTEFVVDHPGNPYSLDRGMEYKIQFCVNGRVLQELQIAAQEGSSEFIALLIRVYIVYY